MKKIGIIILVCVCLLVSFVIYNEIDERYYGIKANWQCSNEDFESLYYPLYENEILRLKEKHGLDCEYHSESKLKDNGDLRYTFYLYSEDYTIKISVANCARGEIGYYDIEVFYYSENRINEDYAVVKSIAEFSNDITNFMAYDTVTESNQFEELYNQAKNSDQKYASNYYHFDNSVGNVGYHVNLNDSNRGYYYLAKNDSSVEKLCHVLTFEGLLKTQ